MSNRQEQEEIVEILNEAVDDTKRFVSSARDYVETISRFGHKEEIVPYSPTTQVAVGVSAGYAGGKLKLVTCNDVCSYFAMMSV